MKILLAILLVSYFSFAIMGCDSDDYVHALDASDKDRPKCDTITREKFFPMVGEAKAIMDKHEQVSLNKAIEMIRIYNTTSLVSINSDSLYKDLVAAFSQQFDKDYFKQLATQIGYTYGKGMTLYSQKHDLFIGQGMTYRCQDYITIK